jgi:hypothetical protein
MAASMDKTGVSSIPLMVGVNVPMKLSVPKAKPA